MKSRWSSRLCEADMPEYHGHDHYLAIMAGATRAKAQRQQTEKTNMPYPCRVSAADFKAKYPHLYQCLVDLCASKMKIFLKVQEAALVYVRRLKEIGVEDFPEGPMLDLSDALEGEEDVVFLGDYLKPRIPADLEEIEQNHAACSEIIKHLRLAAHPNGATSIDAIGRFLANEAGDLVCDIEIDFFQSDEFQDLLRRSCEVLLGRQPGEQK